MHAPLSTHEIDRLARSCPHGTYTLAALHVALPTTSVVGLDAQLHPDTGTASWRGERTSLAGNSDDIAEQLYDLVTRAWRASDRAIETCGVAPAVKTLRSGAYHVAFGAELYVDRKVLVETTFTDPAAVARSYVDTVVRQAQTGGSGVHTLDDNDCLVHDDGRVVVLSHPDGPIQSGAVEGDPWNSIDAIAVELAAAFDIDGFEVATLGSRTAGTVDVDYVGTFTEHDRRYDLIIPAILGAGTVLGAPYGAAAPAIHDWYDSGNRDPWYGLSAYEPIVAASVEPGWLARHRSSGIVVLLRAAD